MSEEFADRQDMVLAIDEAGNFMLAETEALVAAERQDVINGQNAQRQPMSTH